MSRLTRVLEGNPVFYLSPEEYLTARWAVHVIPSYVYAFIRMLSFMCPSHEKSDLFSFFCWLVGRALNRTLQLAIESTWCCASGMRYRTGEGCGGFLIFRFFFSSITPVVSPSYLNS